MQLSPELNRSDWIRHGLRLSVYIKTADKSMQLLRPENYLKPVWTRYNGTIEIQEPLGFVRVD